MANKDIKPKPIMTAGHFGSIALVALVLGALLFAKNGFSFTPRKETVATAEVNSATTSQINQALLQAMNQEVNPGNGSGAVLGASTTVPSAGVLIRGPLPIEPRGHTN